MGLDMYLERHVYVGANYKHNNVTGIVEIVKNAGTDHERKINVRLDRISEIVESVGYWRKANAIHAWFVQNVQDGQDDCKSYYVDKSQLEELYDLCDTIVKGSVLKPGKLHAGTQFSDGKVEELYEDGMIIENPELADKLLPTQEGFFFGSTDYNGWYIEDLKDTMAILKPILDDEDDDASYYYSSSW